MSSSSVPPSFDRDGVNLWQRAAAFAAHAHRHGFRKDGATPYFSHPARVAMTTATIFKCHDPETLAIALLHDTIEDTTVDYDDLAEHFGPTIADAVACLTKDMRLPESERERAYDEQLRRGPWQARLVKLADVLDNHLDAFEETQRRKSRVKIERMLALAGDEPAIADAKRIVALLLEA